MISSDVMRGFNDLLILIVLSQGDSYGYEISKNIIDISNGLYNLKETTLYSAIKRLEKNGYITGYDSDETYGRKRINYSISNRGEKYLKEKIEEWKSIEILMGNFVSKYKEEKNG